jgi:hypothetical protein
MDLTDYIPALRAEVGRLTRVTRLANLAKIVGNDRSFPWRQSSARHRGGAFFDLFASCANSDVSWAKT